MDTVEDKFNKLAEALSGLSEAAVKELEKRGFTIRLPYSSELDKLLLARKELTEEYSKLCNSYNSRLEVLTQKIEDTCTHAFTDAKFLYDDHDGWSKPATVTSTYEKKCEVCGKVERFTREYSY